MESFSEFAAFNEDAGKRIDVFLTERCQGYSRKHLQQILQEGEVEINGKKAKKSDKLCSGDTVKANLPQIPEKKFPQPVKLPLDIRYEDDEIIVVNKPQGLVVHLGNGTCEETLVDALLYHTRGKLSDIGGELRPGIVHRIDKDTSGLLLVAKTNKAHMHLAKQLEEHSVNRKYFAIAHGRFSELEGTLDTFLIRDPKNRVKKKSIAQGDIRFSEFPQKRAVTHYSVMENFEKYAYLNLALETGRTHQIRVHMASINHPLVGDMLYGKGKKELGVARQMLHAGILGFAHPDSGAYMEFQSEPPTDFLEVLEKLRKANL